MKEPQAQVVHWVRLRQALQVAGQEQQRVSAPKKKLLAQELHASAEQMSQLEGQAQHKLALVRQKAGLQLRQLTLLVQISQLGSQATHSYWSQQPRLQSTQVSDPIDTQSKQLEVEHCLQEEPERQAPGGQLLQVVESRQSGQYEGQGKHTPDSPALKNPSMQKVQLQGPPTHCSHSAKQGQHSPLKLQNPSEQSMHAPTPEQSSHPSLHVSQVPAITLTKLPMGQEVQAVPFPQARQLAWGHCVQAWLGALQQKVGRHCEQEEGPSQSWQLEMQGRHWVFWQRQRPGEQASQQREVFSTVQEMQEGNWLLQLTQAPFTASNPSTHEVQLLGDPWQPLQLEEQGEHWLLAFWKQPSWQLEQVNGDMHTAQLAGHCWHRPIPLRVQPIAQVWQVSGFLQVRQLGEQGAQRLLEFRKQVSAQVVHREELEQTSQLGLQERHWKVQMSRYWVDLQLVQVLLGPQVTQPEEGSQELSGQQILVAGLREQPVRQAVQVT